MKKQIKKLLVLGMLCLGFSTYLHAQIVVTTAYAISGPSVICSSETYSISPTLPAGISVTWSVTGDISISGSTTSSTVTVVKTAVGSGTITATISDGCGSGALTKTVTTIAPPQITSISFFNSANDGGYWCSSNGDNGFEIFSTSVDPVSCEVQLLSYPGLSVLYTATVSSGSQISGWPLSPGFYVFQARIVDGPCGTGNWFGTEVDAVNCLNPGHEWDMVYPNPGNTEINVTYNRPVEKLSTGKKAVAAGSYQIRLLNNKGQVLREVVNDASKTATKIDISTIQNGTYILHIIDKDKIIRKQVIIKH